MTHLLIRHIRIIIAVLIVLALYNYYGFPLANHSFYLKLTKLRQDFYEVGWNKNVAAHKPDEKSLRTRNGNNLNKPKMACILPKLSPFNPILMNYTRVNMTIDCEAKHPKMFTTDLKSNLIQLAHPEKIGYHSCCYQNFTRDLGNKDTKIFLDKTCVPINHPKTPIPKTMDFILVSCKNRLLDKNSSLIQLDAFGLVHFKAEVEQRIANGQKLWSPLGLRLSSENNGTNGKNPVKFLKKERWKDLNVVIFGVDSVAHMNFIRTFPLTFEYITKNLSAYGLNGYVQVGLNSFENLVPALSGLTADEFVKLPSCYENGSLPFDECPLIWKNYSNRGYRTAFGEDAVRWSIFNYLKTGFMLPPTDYYIHHLSHQLRDVLSQEKNSHDKKVACNDPRPGHQLLLDFLKKMAFTMGKTRKYFQMLWSTALTHNYVNGGKLADKPLFETLKWLKDGGYLENTVFILMSDHGLLRSTSWNVPPTAQGKIENRMPLLYLMFPEWFQKEHPSAFQNLKINENRLTTHFDLHETLLDILMHEKLDDVQKRTQNQSFELPRGISLFLPIPMRRTCKDAGIASQWCTCNPFRPISVKNNSLIKEGASRGVSQINGLLRPYPQCQPLSLKNVLSAEIFLPDEKDWKTWDTLDMIVEDLKTMLNNRKEATFRITFVVAPTDGVFEVTATHGNDGRWQFSKYISRLDTYGDQGFCVQNYRVERFCCCIK